uniref:Glycosyltransferase family 92 protein n=1 Tax=Ascaris lumbricoides TaxID=6252 RepID=A0A0M3HT34_ASCLU
MPFWPQMQSEVDAVVEAIDWLLNYWAEVKDPASISFENFAEVELEKYIWPSGLRSKVIMVPELIRGAHVHNVLHTEKRSKIVTIRKDDAIVFHLRRVAKRDNIATNGTKTSRELARFIKPCEKLWSDRQKRIRDIPGTEILHAKIWPNRGLQRDTSIQDHRRDDRRFNR